MPIQENSIRIRLILLVVLALAISLAAYLHVGTKLVSHFEDAEQKRLLSSEVTVAEARARQQIDRSLDFIRAAAALLPDVPEEKQNRWIEEKFMFASARLGWRGWVVLADNGANELLGTLLQAGEDAAAVERSLQRLGWHSVNTRWKTERLALIRAGRLLIADASRDSSGKLRVFGVSIAIQSLAPESTKEESPERPALHLAVRDGERLVALLFTPGSAGLESADGDQAAAMIAGRRAPAPVRESVSVRVVQISEKPHLVAYRWMRGGSILVSAIRPWDRSGLSTTLGQTFVRRTLVVAAAVLLLVVGLSLIVLEGLVRRGRGSRPNAADPAPGLPEPDALGTDDEHEILHDGPYDELIESMQKRLFPGEPFRDPNFLLSGRHLTSGACAGDWWSYRRSGRYLVITLGEVSGRGPATALVTAEVHGAFSLLMNHYEDFQKAPSPVEIVERMNEAVYTAARGEHTMTFVASVLDLSTGRISTVNASHLPPYLYRAGDLSMSGASGDGERSATVEGTEADVPVLTMQKPAQLQALAITQSRALGEHPHLAPVTPAEHQLHPGDLLIWYTRGLLECTQLEAGRGSASALMRIAAEAFCAPGDDSEAFCQELENRALALLEQAPEERQEDVSFLIGLVPASAQLNLA